jgi:hypothetical protein
LSSFFCALVCPGVRPGSPAGSVVAANAANGRSHRLDACFAQNDLVGRLVSVKGKDNLAWRDADGLASRVDNLARRVLLCQKGIIDLVIDNLCGLAGRANDERLVELLAADKDRDKEILLWDSVVDAHSVEGARHVVGKVDILSLIAWVVPKREHALERGNVVRSHHLEVIVQQLRSACRARRREDKPNVSGDVKLKSHALGQDKVGKHGMSERIKLHVASRSVARGFLPDREPDRLGAQVRGADEIIVHHAGVVKDRSRQPNLLAAIEKLLGSGGGKDDGTRGPDHLVGRDEASGKVCKVGRSVGHQEAIA